MVYFYSVNKKKFSEDHYCAYHANQMIKRKIYSLKSYKVLVVKKHGQKA